MTKKSKSNRFDYATQEASQGAPEVQALEMPEVQASSETMNPALISTVNPASPALSTVARRAGRMAQDREQLNVRLPTQLKRQALAAAALEGLTVGELIEHLLLEHLNTRSAQLTP